MTTAMRSLIIISIILIIFSGCIEIKDDNPAKNPDKVKTKNVTKNVTNDTIPPSSISYLQSKAGPDWVGWTWENPEDKDFSHVIIFIDGKFKVNVTKPKNYYNLTRLPSEKQYSIGIRTVDMNKNINPYWVNDSTSTLPKFKDMIPPDKIWYLEVKVGKTWINWTWENPEDKDFKYTNIYIDGKFVVNLTKPKSSYNLTGLISNTTKTISIRTVDANKNINLEQVSNIATTLS